jgi:hypothetical protein
MMISGLFSDRAIQAILLLWLNSSPVIIFSDLRRQRAVKISLMVIQPTETFERYIQDSSTIPSQELFKECQTISARQAESPCAAKLPVSLFTNQRNNGGTIPLINVNRAHLYNGLDMAMAPGCRFHHRPPRPRDLNKISP